MPPRLLGAGHTNTIQQQLQLLQQATQAVIMSSYKRRANRCDVVVLNGSEPLRLIREINKCASILFHNIIHHMYNTSSYLYI